MFTPDDLKSVPPSEPHVVAGPSIQSEMLRELRGSAYADHRRSDQSANIRPFSGAWPILDLLSMAAEIQGDSAGGRLWGRIICTQLNR